jgi:hypothetical protein
MKKKYILFFLLSYFNYNFSSYDTIINLGGDCQVAWQLKLNNLRPYSLPFDWLVIPCSAIIKLLDNNFNNFLAKESLTFINKQPYPHIRDHLYSINLLHTFTLSENFLDTYDEVKAKYDKRTARFWHLINQGKKVLFIRKGITKIEAIDLDLVLQRLYPSLEYTILALDATNIYYSNEEIKENWELERVINIYLKQTEPYTWQGDSKAWKEILSDFDIKLPNHNEKENDQDTRHEEEHELTRIFNLMEDSMPQIAIDDLLL